MYARAYVVGEDLVVLVGGRPALLLLERVADLDPSEAAVVAIVRPDRSDAVLETSTKLSAAA